MVSWERKTRTNQDRPAGAGQKPVGARQISPQRA